MPLDGMGAAHLRGKGEAALESQRQNNAILEIDGLVDDEGEVGGIVQVSIRTFDLPSTNFEVIEEHFLNDVVKFLGKQTIDSMSVEFARYFQNDVGEIIEAWADQVLNPGSKGAGVRRGVGPTQFRQQGLARDYKKNGTVLLMAPDGEFHRAYNVYGLMPESISRNTIDYSSAEPLRLNLTLALDRVEYVGPDVAGL